MEIRTVAELAAVVRGERARCRLTQAELAKQAGVSRNWIVSLESGKAVRAELGRVLAVLAVLQLPLTLPARPALPANTDLPENAGLLAVAVDPPEFDLDAHVSSFVSVRPLP